MDNEYTNYNLVFASTSGMPNEGATISRLFNKLISDNDLPRGCFHSIRHTSTTYKLMISQQFYSGPVSEEPAAQPDPLQQLDDGEKQTLLIKLLAESPEMAAMKKTMAQIM